MRFEKVLVEKSVNALMKKADDCFDLAKTQHEAADQQHEMADKQHEMADKQHEIAHEQHDSASNLDTSADKLDLVSQSLTAEAIALKGELEMDAGRTSPRLRLLLAAAPPESCPIPKAIPK